MDGTWRVPYVVSNQASFIEEDGARVYQRTSVDGRNYFYQFDDFGLQMREWSREIDLQEDVNSSGEYLFPLPIQKEQKWRGHTRSQVLIKTGPPQKTEFRITARVPVVSVIQSTNEKITVPAGTFENCIKVHLSGSTFHNAGNYVGNTVVKVREDRWYCPGAGLVRSVRDEATTNSARDKGRLMLELEQLRF